MGGATLDAWATPQTLSTAQSVAVVWLLPRPAQLRVRERFVWLPGRAIGRSSGFSRDSDEGGAVRETADQGRRRARRSRAPAALGRNRDSTSTRVRNARRRIGESHRHGDGRVDRRPRTPARFGPRTSRPGPATLSRPRGLRVPEHRQVYTGLACTTSWLRTQQVCRRWRGRTDSDTPADRRSSTRSSEVTVADRGPAGGARPSSPAVLGAGFVSSHALAVNASGAALMAWDQFEGRRQRLYAVLPPRPPAQDGRLRSWWPRTRRCRRPGIDDAGRVVLLFSRGNNARERLYAVRRTADGGWGSSERLTGGGFLGSDFTVSPNGSAMVLRDRTGYEGDPVPGSQFTLRMTPSGRWQSPARHPAPTGTVSSGIPRHGCEWAQR